MPFIFSNTVSDAIRNRNMFQLGSDILNGKKRGRTAPDELPNLAIHGITPNGTYFFCNFVYQKNLSERKKFTVLALIDEYANTQDLMQRINLKNKIKEACGDQIEGIALLLSNTDQTYGFVTGTRIKVARWRDDGPLTLDTNEMLTYPDRQLSFRYFAFILDNEEQYKPELIRQFTQGYEDDDNIDTEVINAIKRINVAEERDLHLALYLQAARLKIQNHILQQQVGAIYDMLQHIDTKTRCKAIVLTLQLLHSQNMEERMQSLSDYAEFASQLYGSKVPKLMIAGIGIFLLGVSLLTLSLLTAPIIPVSFVGGAALIVGLYLGIVGKNAFFNEQATQKRNLANRFFNLDKALDNIVENEPIIPCKITASCT